MTDFTSAQISSVQLARRSAQNEDGLRLANTQTIPTPAQAFAGARKIVDNKVEGPRKRR
jgi:hypothetical protein